MAKYQRKAAIKIIMAISIMSISKISMKIMAKENEINNRNNNQWQMALIGNGENNVSANNGVAWWQRKYRKAKWPKAGGVAYQWR